MLFRSTDPVTRRAIGYVPEQFRFPEWLHAADFVGFHASLAGVPSHERSERIVAALDMVGLAHRRNDVLGTFSKGMLQRVGIAQALVGRPRLVVLDLAYYCNHRFVHRVNIGWAAHQAHHSSEYMNFATALRQKWNPWFEFFFWLPLPFLGFAPWTLYVAFSINLVYQFFVHTETIDRLPRPIELVLNTPSHHRVHHGSDPEYLDKNYAGILIVWDRMFGTFQPERQRPTYGLKIGRAHV